MSLPIGTRIGPYVVTAPLGAGGMGEVFRARDTRLDRDVALKILPAEFASDPERLMRFEREAKTLAALNHPNIAAIHGIEDTRRDDGTVSRALIMELVDGEDLSQRLARGPISIEDALPIARQIALALEAAHEQGIVHRDLKPANVKVRPDGTVKVLDFGLAKGGVATGASGADLANSPTITSPATMQGTILGTAAYMAPEQARGQVVDRRADIWAFGCVLYEMLTGRRAFGGASVTDVLAAVLKSDPDWRALPADTPGAVRRVLRRCLTRDRAERVQHIGDARLDLVAGPEPDAIAPATVRAVGPSRAMTASGWVVALAALAFGLWSVSGRNASHVTRPAYEFSVLPPTGSTNPPVISPDGRHLAYQASNRIWLRSLDRAEARPLDGTEAGAVPSGRPTAASSDSSPARRSSGSISREAVRRMSRRCRKAGRWPPGRPRAASWSRSRRVRGTRGGTCSSPGPRR